MSAFVDEQRERFGVEPICRALGVSASAYYQRATGERCQRAVEDERLLDLIGATHAANYYAYGYRRTWKALLRAGHEVGRDRVKRLMRRAGIQGAKRRGKPWRTTVPDPGALRPPDLVDRDFSAARPDELWLADFTYLRCWEGLVFFSFVIDAYSRRVVGWQFANHMRTDLVLDALRMALTRRQSGADVELIHHSDAGSQYTSHAFSRSSTITACWARSARSVTPTTTPWPKASSTASRPNSSPTASGAPAPSSSWRSSNGSPGSTTTACTRVSATSHRRSPRPSTRLGTF